MKKLLFFLVLLPALLGLAPSAPALEIKLVTLARPGSPQRVVAEGFKQRLEARSAGAFTVAIDPAAQPATEAAAIDGIQTNAFQMGILTAEALEPFNPIVAVIAFPFLFRSEQQAASILDGPLGAAIFRDLETIGFKGLAFSEAGFRQLTNNIRPVRTVADLEGLKIRVPATSVPTATWLALGADPAPRPWPIYAELEKGRIDGQDNPLWIVETYRFFAVQRYLTLTRHSYGAHLGLASLKWWQTLSRPEQEMIQTAMIQAAQAQRHDQRVKETARLARLKDQGMVIEEQPDLDEFRVRTAKIKGMSLYREPRVQVLLTRMQEASQTGTAAAVEGLPRSNGPAEPAPTAPLPSASQDPPPLAPSPQRRPSVAGDRPVTDKQPPSPPPEAAKTETRQPTALELLDAPMPEPPAPPAPPPPPVRIIHQGRNTSDGETLPPIIEERIPGSPEPATVPYDPPGTVPGPPPAQ